MARIKKAFYPILVFILIGIVSVVGIGIYNEVKLRKQSDELYSSDNLSDEDLTDSTLTSDIKPDNRKSEIDFEEEREQFKDIVGYIKLLNAEVDYPIVQGMDNDFYLEHLANGEKNIYGSIFLDYRCMGDFSSEVSVIYGHDASNGSMFGSLEKYEKQEFYNEIKSYRIFAPNGDFDVFILGGYLLEGATGQYPGGFIDENDFVDFIDEVKEKSLFESDFEVHFGERIVILSTCSNKFEDARFALVGVVR